jgi:hypothetical protein
MKLLTICLAACLMICSGCASYRVQIPPPSIEPGQFSELEVLTFDGAVFSLEEAIIDNTEIKGIGWKYEGAESPMAFNGSISLADVSLIQVKRKDPLSFLVTATAVIAVYAVLGQGSEYEDKGGNVRITSPSYGGGGSCPYVYSFDGQQYQLDAEPFAGSICKSLERSTVEILDNLQPTDDFLNIAFCNQALESHYINSFDLVAVDHPVGSKIMAGADGGLHALQDPVPALWSRSRSSGEITGLLDHTDGQFWESDLSSVDVAVDSTLVDEIVCGFSRPPGSDAGKLVLHLSNTSLTEYAFDKLLYLCGPATLSWYHSIATEPDQRNLLLAWMLREGCLKVSVRTADRWQPVSLIPHVGGAVSVNRVVDLDLAGVSGEILEIKLQGTAGLWRLDEVSMDWSVQEVGRTIPLSLVSLQNENAPLSTHEVLKNDDQYLALYPDDWVTARYASPKTPALGRYTYVLTAGGHYYNWPKQLGELDQRPLVRSILAKPFEGSRMFLNEWQTGYQELTPPVAPATLPIPPLGLEPDSS